MKRRLRGLVVLGIVLAAWGLVSLPLYSVLLGVEFKLQDAWLRGSPRREPVPAIAVVAIDSASEDALGRWPWPRSTHARLIDRLTAAGARAIVFDVSFSRQTEAAEDSALIAACRRSGRVVVARSVTYDGQEFQLDTLVAGLDQVATVGLASVRPDSDGMLRRIDLTPLDHRAEHWALCVRALQVFTGQEFRPAVFGHDLEALLGETRIPVFTRVGISQNVLVLNFPGRGFPTFSYADVLEGKVPDSEFKNRLVLIGSTGDPLDRFRVPRGSDGRPDPSMPGVLAAHGTAIDTILSGNFLRWGEWELGPRVHLTLTMLLFWIMLPLMAVLFLVLVPRLKVPQSLALGAVLTALLLGASWAAFQRQVLIPVVHPITILWLSMAGVLVYDTHRSRRALAQFMPSHDVEAMIRAPDLQKEKQETLVCTILFVDLRDYTTLSEGRTPEEVRQLVDRFHTAVGEVVQKHGGYVCDFQGDAQMVAFGLNNRSGHEAAAMRAAQ
ncbi:MAG: adenylate/guanylate cyclase domain-containing protein, partial [Candidatus Eremiobacterota bacterium]